MARLLYSSGLRHQECLRLRVMDIDFGRNEITVRQGNGDKDQRTMLPLSEKMEWEAHLRRFRHLHERDLSRGFGSVWLPEALERKFPNAAREWPWQWVFPSAVLSGNPRTGTQRRHHAHEGSVSRAITQAVAALG